MLLNSDVEQPGGWLEPLVETMERNPDVEVVVPKLISEGELRMVE